MPDRIGICPLCTKNRGPIGDPCQSDLCKTKGYHFIDEHEIKKVRRGTILDPLLGIAVRKYVLVGKIGAGGMGAVYRALQKPLDREVALKVIAGIELAEENIKRFEREAKAIALMEHPNIVQLYDFGVDESKGNLTFMVMQFISEGRTLEEENNRILVQRTHWQLKRIDNIFGQILNALTAAHNRGVVHRDIKPQNIMLKEIEGDADFVKVLDFGLAKAFENVRGMDDVTATGKILGTPQYIAPEQIVGSKLDHRVDIYATGVMLLELLTGRNPFPGDTPRAVLAYKLTPDFTPLKEADRQLIAEPIYNVILGAIHRDADKRFSSAQEMRKALSDAVAKVLTEQGPNATGTIVHDRKDVAAPAPVATVAPSGEVPTPRGAAPFGIGDDDGATLDASDGLASAETIATDSPSFAEPTPAAPASTATGSEPVIQARPAPSGDLAPAQGPQRPAWIMPVVFGMLAAIIGLVSYIGWTLYSGKDSPSDQQVVATSSTDVVEAPGTTPTKDVVASTPSAGDVVSPPPTSDAGSTAPTAGDTATGDVAAATDTKAANPSGSKDAASTSDAVSGDTKDVPAGDTKVTIVTKGAKDSKDAPPLATIYVNDKKQGSSPLTLTMAPGKYDLTCELEGTKDKKKPKKTQTVEIDGTKGPVEVVCDFSDVVSDNADEEPKPDPSKNWPTVSFKGTFRGTVKQTPATSYGAEEVEVVMYGFKKGKTCGKIAYRDAGCAGKLVCLKATGKNKIKLKEKVQAGANCIDTYHTFVLNGSKLKLYGYAKHKGTTFKTKGTLKKK